LNELKTEHYRIQKENEENTDKLKSELSNSLNVHYLKNVLTSYFTTQDTTVQ
jgi:CRISPR/Cas system-associated endoribonuclease Cas2